MTTVATIAAELLLKNGQFNSGMKQSEKQTVALATKLSSLNSYLSLNSERIMEFGENIQKAGKKMTMFVSVPIIGFLALLIKKALDADTALGKMGKESIAKLNASLVTLGTKFLPLLIRFVDWLTKMVDKFNNASPATQQFIATLVALAALIGPIMSLAGWLISTVSFLGGMGFSLAAVGSAVSAFGAALVALLPVIALVLAVLFLVMLVWNNWGTIITTLKQLWFLFVYALKKGASEIVNAAKFIYNVFKTAFGGIGKAIDWVVGKIKMLMAALANLKLPDALTPGSPTPFEMGLVGIGKAMDNLSKKNLPKLNMGLNGVGGNGRGNVNITDNRRFAGGMGAEELRTALDSRINGLAGAI